MDQYIALIQENAWFAFIGIVLLSYILEDLAIITAAILASGGSVSPPVALTAIFVGIASGDALLYGLGIWARRWRGLRYRLLTMRYLREAKRRMASHAIVNIFIIRFIPGLRSVSFTLCGYFRIPFAHFLSAVLLASALWTLLVFGVIYQLGSVEWLQNQTWKWLLGPVALLALFAFNRYASHSLRSTSKG